MLPIHPHSLYPLAGIHLLTPPPPHHLTASPSRRAFRRDNSHFCCYRYSATTIGLSPEIHSKAYLDCMYRALRHFGLYFCPPSYHTLLCARAAYLPFANWTLPVLQAGRQQSAVVPVPLPTKSAIRNTINRANHAPGLSTLPMTLLTERLFPFPIDLAREGKWAVCVLRQSALPFI